MISPFITAIIAACSVAFSIGCHHREAATIVPVPMGLDSAGVARWVAQQRTACRGRLVTLWDEGGRARNFDSTATSTEFRYHSYSYPASVVCQP
jgi:hypothetical protein